MRAKLTDRLGQRDREAKTFLTLKQQPRSGLPLRERRQPSVPRA